MSDPIHTTVRPDLHISRLQNHMLFTPAKGLTPLFDAVYLGLETMKSARNKRKALLVITGGEDNHSRYSFWDIKEFVKKQDVQIFVIGIVNSTGELAQNQNGRAIIEDLAQINGMLLGRDQHYKRSNVSTLSAVQRTPVWDLLFAATPLQAQSCQIS